MKQKTVDKVLLIYKYLSAISMTAIVFASDYRAEIFYLWWLSTALLMVYLLVNIFYLAHLKQKISGDRPKGGIKDEEERKKQSSGKKSD